MDSPFHGLVYRGGVRPSGFRIPLRTFAPLSFLAYNAHIYYGEKHADRTNESVALLNWLFRRWGYAETIFSPNFIVLGDMTHGAGRHPATIDRLEPDWDGTVRSDLSADAIETG